MIQQFAWVVTQMEYEWQEPLSVHLTEASAEKACRILTTTETQSWCDFQVLQLPLLNLED